MRFAIACEPPDPDGILPVALKLGISKVTPILLCLF